MGFVPHKAERLSRVDFAFDYHLPVVDFDADCFLARMHKDSQLRENGRVQTFTLGQGDIALRVYDKTSGTRPFLRCQEKALLSMRSDGMHRERLL